MTDTPDFEGLRGLLERATPGPWHWVDPENDEPWDSETALDQASLRTVEHFRTYPNERWELPKFIIDIEDGLNSENVANAALIVAAVNALPTLLAEVARLTAELERARPLLEGLMKYAAGPVGNLAWRDVLDHARAYAQAKETP